MKRCSIILLRFSLIVLSITLFMNFGICYAVSFDTVDSYINQTADYYTNITVYQTLKSYFNNNTTLRNYISQICNDYDNFCYGRNVSFNFVYYITFANFNNNTANTNGSVITGTGKYRTIQIDTRYNSIDLYSESSFSNSTPSDWGSIRYMSTTANNYNNLTGMCYENLTFNGTVGQTYVGKGGYNPLTYLEFNNTFIDNTTHNGNLFTYYYKGDFYSQSQIKIGTIIPNDSYYYEIYLKDNSTNIIKGTIYCNVEDLNIFNGDGALYLDNNQNLYVTTRLLNYSTQYKLEITSYYGDGGDNLYEDIDWIIFLPQNATFSGDYILSFGSGDFTEQDNANQIIDNVVSNINDMSNVSSEIDTFISGDLAGTLGFTEYDSSGDIWRATIINFTDQVADALMYSGDPYYDISLHGETPVRIYASNFTTPETPLKVFVRLALIFGCLYAIYFQLFTVFNMLTCGAPDEVIGNLAPDIYLYRM